MTCPIEFCGGFLVQTDGEPSPYRCINCARRFRIVPAQRVARRSESASVPSSITTPTRKGSQHEDRSVQRVGSLNIKVPQGYKPALTNL